MASLFRGLQVISFFGDLSALDVVDHLRKPVDLLFGVVEGKGGSYGAFNTEAS